MRRRRSVLPRPRGQRRSRARRPRGSKQPVGKMKKILASFWVQVGSLCFLTALAVTLRLLLLPSRRGWQISPFASLFEIHLSLYTLLPPAAFAAFILSLKRALKRGTAVKLAYFTLAFFVLTTTVNMAGGGDKILPGAIWQYCFDAQKLYAQGNFLRDYHLHVEGMHWHTTVHPPGIFVYLFPLLKLFGKRWIFVALLNALLAGAGVIFAYKAGRRLAGAEAGDAVAALYVTAPSLILYGSTIDAVLCALGAAVVYLLARYFGRGRFTYAVLTALALAAGAFVAYQFGFVWILLLAWSITYAVYKRKNARARGDVADIGQTAPASPPRNQTARLSGTRLAALAAAAAVAFALFFVAVYLASGFDVITEFQHQQRASELYFGAGANVIYLFKRYVLGAPAYATKHRSYLMWVPGNFVAFFFLLGPATTILFLRNLWREMKEKEARRKASGLSPAAAVSFVLVNLTGLTLAETERVWLFMVPWFLVGAGYYLRKENPRLLYPILLLNLAISFLFVTFFYHVK